MSAETVLSLCGACLAFGIWWGQLRERQRRGVNRLVVDNWLERVRGRR